MKILLIFAYTLTNNNAMATVHFKLKDPKSDSPSLIYLIFSFGYTKEIAETGKKKYIPLKYSTKLKVLPQYWNTETARVSEASGFETAREFNERLDEIELNIKDIYRKLVDRNFEVVPWVLSRELNFRMGRKSKKRSLSFDDFVEKYIEHSKIRKSPATISKYQKTVFHLNAYAAKKNKKLNFESFNLNFYKDFTSYLQVDLGFSDNTVGKYIATLKLFLNEAASKGVNKHMGFKHKSFRIKSEKVDKVVLAEEEIQRICHFNFSSRRLERIKDIFCILCYSGISYGELKSVDISHVFTENEVKYLPIGFKTNRRTIPLHVKVQDIIARYGGDFPEIISQQRINEYLKEVLFEIFKDEQGNVSSEYLTVSCETAKRSFVLMLYNQGVDLETILYLGGFKQAPSFLLKHLEKNKKSGELLVEHPFFNRK